MHRGWIRARRSGLDRAGVEQSHNRMKRYPPFSDGGWHMQHFVQFVPAVHLSQTGFLCFEELARELAMDDVTKL